jgi:hypothetical protein
MITFAPNNLCLWVKTPLGDGVLLYVRSLAHDNDEWTVMLDNGDIKHFNTSQIKAYKNHTLEINLENK